MTQPVIRIPVGVVVARRKAESRWADHVWQPQSILVGEPETPPWTVLSLDGDTTLFYAGATQIELYRNETSNYRMNLHGDRALWVVLRAVEGAFPYELFRVTADPAEGEVFTEAGNDLVDKVPMPPVIEQTLAAFVAEHHVEETFFKRQRTAADPQALARRAPRTGDRDR